MTEGQLSIADAAAVGRARSRHGCRAADATEAESARTMPQEPVNRAKRRVIILITVVMAVILVTVGTTVWNWMVTVAAWQSSVREEAAAARSVALASVFAQERPLMVRYLARPQPALLAQVRADQAQFLQLAGQVGPGTAAG